MYCYTVTVHYFCATTAHYAACCCCLQRCSLIVIVSLELCCSCNVSMFIPAFVFLLVMSSLSLQLFLCVSLSLVVTSNVFHLPLFRPIPNCTALLVTDCANQLMPVAQNGGSRGPSAISLLMSRGYLCTSTLFNCSRIPRGYLTSGVFFLSPKCYLSPLTTQKPILYIYECRKLFRLARRHRCES